jgi:branched-chain amino acid transport system permease protein
MTRQVDVLQTKPTPLGRSRFLSTLNLANIPRRGLILLALLLALLIAAPAFTSDYLLSILILILYFAYTGQAWNVMMGFAGQLSLGHALYVGIGAYMTAALFIHFGTPPWIGLLVAVPIAMAAGAVIGFLAFRFRVAGTYFAILTIAFAEFARIGFDHWDWVGASSGLFLPVATYTQNDLWHLRGRPIMFYYLILAMTVLAFLLCRWLLGSRLGYFWQAVREDEEAARAVGIATFRTKMAAVVISAGLTSFAGMFYAFYYNNLFGEQVFSIGRSIEIILGPLIGGVGTLFGPVLGAFLLTGLAETLTEILGLIGVDLPGAKQVFYGFCLLVVITLMPEGVWPWLKRALGLEQRQ